MGGDRPRICHLETKDGLEKESTEEKDSKEKVRQVKEVKMSFIGDELPPRRRAV
jgi:hypothetical protein